MFNLLIAGAFAQEEPVPDPDAGASETASLPETQAVDPAVAAEWERFWDNSPSGAAQSASSASTFSILRILLTLVLAAAAIYGLVFLVKRFSRGGAARSPFLKVLASAPLGTNRGVHILSVGSQAWLVGSAESGVSLISEIQDKDALDAMLLEDSRISAESLSVSNGRLPDFKALLQRLGMPAASGTPPGPENIRSRSERLKGL